ncbi:SusD/RagB family nutrient-binding outer membrane lipoprotein [Chryseobacterium sp. VD8]|uniref:SusD/RagB family nutrient-binding outer membrane lipoprotein n=1 Tax=Chryseobacterium sp. VD8 TaxID=3081254 RepID=UPI00301AADAD
MKKISLKLYITAALGALVLTSCGRDYLDVNENPNSAYLDQLSPKELLPGAETQTYRTQAGLVNRFGNVMMNAWAGNNYYYAGPFQQEYAMIANSTFYNGIWDGYYAGAGYYDNIIKTPNAVTNYPKHVAIARIMKAFYMQTIVDLYNDVPYSDAFKRQSNPTPKYDKGKDIYKDLVSELDKAITALGATGGTTVAATEDPINGGDLTKWTQFARTIKLRILVRLSKCTDPDMVALRNQLKTSLASTATTSYITSDITINPGYASGNADQQNPLYRNFGRVDINSGQVNSTYRLIVASKHIIDNMRGLAPRTSGLVDARTSRIFINNGLAQAGLADYTVVGFKGIEQGSNKDLNFLEGDFATLGPKMFYLSTANGSVQNGIIMSLAEAKLLQAEAALTYPEFTAALGDGQARFNEAITDNFTFLGATNSAAYIANANTKVNIGWTGTNDNKLAAIQYQRWIALTNINPVETYIGYTKTGYPVTPMPIGANYPDRPKRLMYPQSEYIANSANVPNPQISEMYSATSQYAPFWLK